MSAMRIYKYIPSNIMTDDSVKMTGHNLKGMKLILNPVNNEITDRRFKAKKQIHRMIKETLALRSIAATADTIAPINTRVTPSFIHSILMMFLLSFEISPKPFTTDTVGKRWAIPHNASMPDEMNNKH